MPQFTIYLAARRIKWNPIKVEAPTVADACRAALQKDDLDYEPGDLGDSFVDSVTDEIGKAFVVPADYAEPANRPSPPPFDSRTLATILAGLRLLQHECQNGPRNIPDAIKYIATDGETVKPLSAEEIDSLCELLNCLPKHSSRFGADAESLRALAARAVNDWPQFDCGEEVNGADLVDWFSTWREGAKEALRTAII